MSYAPFPTVPELTAVAIAFRNKKLIADQVLPRVPTAKEFRYNTWDLAEGFTIPNTRIGRTSAANEVEFSATKVDSSCVDYALDDYIPVEDIENAARLAGNYDPKMHATEYIQNLIALDRESRVATAVTTAGNYATANKATLSGTSQWSHASSDPVNAILAAADGMIMRPNIAVMSREVWTKLRQHAKVVAGVMGLGGNATAGGVAVREAVRDLLELDELLIGEGWLNSAKKGQTATIARVWGKHCALIYRDQLANAERGTTYGFTAQNGDRVAGEEFESKRGLRGSVRIRSGESVKEVLCSDVLGYLFTDAVA